MVAIKAAELPGLLKSPSKPEAFLIHGSDAGQVAETARSLAAALKRDRRAAGRNHPA